VAAISPMFTASATLESTARSLGISPETARTYLKRVKAKYRDAGLPVYTKLDLAERVRADCSSGAGRGAARGVRS
jgi:two-component system, NarL family, nitrate/nitrite response regulator NarL